VKLSPARRTLKTLLGIQSRRSIQATGLRADLEAPQLKDAWGDPVFSQLIRLHVAALRNATSMTEPPEAAPEVRASEKPGTRLALEIFGAWRRWMPPPASRSRHQGLTEESPPMGP
jgi:hypothetical protein